MGGFMKVFKSKILRINLSNAKISYENYGIYKEFVGGRGINRYILFNELPLGVSPFDPSNIIAIGTGLLCGTVAPGAARINIDSKSPITGGVGSGSAGGYFAAEMKFAGISNIIITGKCPNLSYIYINDGSIKIVDAERLRGKSTSETVNFLKEKHGDVKIINIGPAGENLVKSACIIVDRSRAVGRCGLGAVMGSKNLKAIAIKGTGSIEVEDPDAFQKITEKITEKILNNEFLKRRIEYGVYSYKEPWDNESPYRNFSGKVPPVNNKEQLMPDNFLKYKKDSKTCSSCPIKCWTIHEFEENGKIIQAEALQGNSIHNFGAKLDMHDAKTVLKAHALCNELGLDEDSACGVVAWAIDCYQKGLLTEDDTGGIVLQWGDYKTIFKLFRDIAFRKGFGNILAEGCKRASEKIGRGTRKYCIHIKGQELWESLWLSPSWALGTVVSPRGGTHTRGAVIEGRIEDLDSSTCEKYFGIPRIGKLTDYQNKERLVFFFERLHAFLDCVGLCFFTNSWRLDVVLPEDYAELFSAATGEFIDLNGLLRIGERAHTLEKAFNILHTNWERKDDMPPKQFVNVPLDGKYRIDLDKWNKMLTRYYRLHGWDTRGLPKKDTLVNLGLDDVAEKLKSRISQN